MAKGTLLIDKIYNYGALTITDNDLYNFLLLPSADDISTDGRIIKANGQSDAASYDLNLDEFCLSVKGGSDGDGKLSIGGNCAESSKILNLYPIGVGGSSVMGVEGWERYDVSDAFNLYQVSVNSGNVSGAVKFYGTSNSLVLTAQNGSANANLAASGNGNKKQDDLIRISSAAYGAYNDRVAGRYKEDGVLSDPYETTVSYTIYATNTLTVVSDLAGQISAEAAAIHAGWRYKNGDKTAYSNNSTNNTIVAAAVKAKDLVLESNFRADLKATNDRSSFRNMLDGLSDEKKEKVVEVEIFAATGDKEEGETTPTPSLETQYLDVNGTTITGYAAPTVSNNTVASYGVWTDSSLKTEENSIWGGTITVATSNVSLLASCEYLHAGKEDDRDVWKATANNNTVAAYGVKSDGSIDIAEMGTLKKDSANGNGQGDDLTASINVSFTNNKLLVKSKGIKDHPAASSASGNVFRAAGIYADTSLTLGKVSDLVNITINATGNKFSVLNNGTTLVDAGTSFEVFGIYAASMSLTNFAGNIIIDATNTTNETKSTTLELGAMGICGGALVSTTNLYGDINIRSNGASVGIYAKKSLTVTGVIGSEINAYSQYEYSGITAQIQSSFGIFVTGKITANAFSGSIIAANGINADSGFYSSVSGDLFDINGVIETNKPGLFYKYTRYGITSKSVLNVRVSGTISADYAIYAEMNLKLNGSGVVTKDKFDDVIELADTAKITGNIDLGAGKNQITISSGAKVEGFIAAAGGTVNLFFNLEGKNGKVTTINKGSKAVINVKEWSDDDKMLKDSQTFTINCNYAELGATYKLLQYDVAGIFSESGIDINAYWQAGRQVAFFYQGNAVTIELTGTNGNLTGEKKLSYFDGGVEKHVTLSAQFSNGGLYVTVGDTDNGDSLDAVKELNIGGENQPAITQTYDKEKEAVTLEWGDFNFADYGLAEIAHYEIKYWLCDEQGNRLYGEQGNKPGESIIVRLDGKAKSFAITGVANNTQLDYQIRLLGDSSANVVTQWSNTQQVTTVDTYVATGADASRFDESTFRSDVLDADPRENTTGVVAAIAELKWEHIESANTIRYYTIEYCTVPTQITIEDAQEACKQNAGLGWEFTTLEDYIAKYLFDDSNPYKPTVYTKEVTGTQIAISGLQNQTYVYWRIQACDSANEYSEWVAGEAFRVWTNNDTAKPIFENKEKDAVIQFIFPDQVHSAPNTEDKTSLYSIILGWDHATDSESGIRAYTVTVKSGKKVVYEHDVNAEAWDTHYYATYLVEDAAAINQDLKYRVVVNGDTDNALAADIRIEGDKIYLKWNSKEAFDGKTLVLQSFVDGNWSDVNLTLGGSNLNIVSYDYSLQIDGLSGNNYTYEITAVDYFGNRTTVENSPQGSFSADVNKPWFDANDSCEVTKTLGKHNDLSSPCVLNGAITFDPATDAESGVRSYVLELYTNGGKKLDRTVVYSAAELENTKTADGKYVIDLAPLGLVGADYTCLIYAKDYIGNLSSNYYSADLTLVDSGAPSFLESKAVISEEYKIVSNGERDVVKITTDSTISWSKAVDVEGDQGVRYYAIYIKAKGEDEWGEAVELIDAGKTADDTWTSGNNAGTWKYDNGVYSWFLDKEYDLAIYDYQIVAYDFFGKTDVISGSFGKTDMSGPTGSFVDGSLSAKVSAKYINVASGQPIIPDEELGEGEEGSEDNNSNNKENDDEFVEPENIVTKLAEATVTLSWKDNFVDESGVIYKVIISDNKYFSGKVYNFYTTEVGEKQMVFSSTSTGRPVSIFENMKTVYWQVVALDTQGNTANSVSGINEFTFTDSDGKKIKLDSAIVAPKRVTVDTSEMADGVHTGRVAVSWSDALSPLGIYRYEIKVYDKNGKVLKYSKDTLDEESLSGTDISSSVSINDGTLSISNLARFFGVSKIEDGEYKLSITGYDANNRFATSEKVDFVVDTVAPDRVNIVADGTFAVADANQSNKVGIRWTAPKATDVKYYVVEYRVKGESKWNTWKVEATEREYAVQVSQNAGIVEFRVHAVDNVGNVGVEWPANEVVEVQTIVDQYSNYVKIPTKLNIQDDEGNPVDLTVSDSVGMGDSADIFSINTSANERTVLTLTAEDIAAVIGKNKNVKISIYSGTNTTKAWKTYTVKDDGRIFTDLLLDAGTTYTFKVENTASASNVSKYTFHISEKVQDLGLLDDDYAEALAYAKSIDLSQSGDYSDWVGYGDTSDYRVLENVTCGKYVFTLKDVAVSTKLTVYEVNGTKLKAVGSITAPEKSIAGVSTKELFLDSSKSYVVEVKVTNGKSIGSDYTVSYEGESFNGYIYADDNSVDTTTFRNIGVEGRQYVGVFDKVDYYNNLQVEAGQAWQFKLTGTNGKAIKAAVGYINSKGKFVALATASGAAGSEELILSRLFTEADLEKAGGAENLVIQVSANGSNANSYYDIESTRLNNVEGFRNDDDKILTTKQMASDTTEYTYDELAAGVTVSSWVGLGDAEDYWKLEQGDSEHGIYKLNITNIENPLKVTIYQAVKDGEDNIMSYKTIKSVTVKAGTPSAVLDDLKLDPKATYYVGVTATGASKGQNSGYSLDLVNLDDLINDTTGTIYDNEASGWVGSYNNYKNSDVIYDLDQIGYIDAGVYSINLSNISGKNIKIVVCDDGGNAVKSFVPAANSNSATFSCEFKDGYYIQVAANGKNISSDYTLSIEKRGNESNCADSVENIVAANTDLIEGTTDFDIANDIASVDEAEGWVGLGDAADVWKLDLTNGTGKYALAFDSLQNDVKVTIYEYANGKKTAVGKTVTVKAANETTVLEDLMLDSSKEYYVQVQATSTNGKKDSEYHWILSNEWTLDTNLLNQTANDDKWNIDDLATVVIGQTKSGAVSSIKSIEDKVDCYKFTVDKNGSYSLALDDINGKMVKISILNSKGKTLQSVTGKAGADSLVLSRELTAGDYYIKIEAVGSNAASDYELTVERNNDLVGFNTSDNTWKQVAANVDAALYNAEDKNIITDWVGLGDTVDVFKVITDENGQLVFSGNDEDTIAALVSKEIKLALVDANGKTIKLTFDQADGDYSTNVNLMADAEYFLSVTSSKPKESSTDYKIAITKNI